MSLEEPFDENDVKTFLDTNHDILVDYLYGLPQSLLFELGIHSVRKRLVSVVEPNCTIIDKLKSLFLNESISKPSLEVPNISFNEMNEGEQFLELFKEIASELDVNVLCFKIMRNICRLTNSDRSILFLSKGPRSERYLVLKLIVTATSSFEESFTTEDTRMKLPFGKSISGHVAQTKTTIIIAEAYDDHRFETDLDIKTGYRTHSIVCKPILSYDGECIGVAQIVNKTGGNTFEFNQRDIDIFERYLMFCGIGITNAQLFEMSVDEYKRNQVMLKVAQDIFKELTDMEKLIKKVMTDMLEIANCQSCAVYLVTEFQQSFSKPSPTKQERRNTMMYSEVVKFGTQFILNAAQRNEMHIHNADFTKCNCYQVAKHVISSQRILNITNIHLDCQYGKQGFERCKDVVAVNVLCMPIYHTNGHIIGCTQQINKVDGKPFNENDENIIKTFSVLIGLGIHNCTMHEHICKLMAKQKVTFEVLSYHALAHPEETKALVKGVIPKAEDLNLYAFHMDSGVIDAYELVKGVIRIFLELGIVTRFKVPYDVLCRWTLSVRKNYYRPDCYHNWHHAFSVCQTVFAMLHTGALSQVFSDLEVLSLLVACLCHDLEYKRPACAIMKSPLATLYSTPITEKNHFDQCIMILNSKGNNVLGSLSSEDYKKALMFIEKAIKYTDLSVYIKQMTDCKALFKHGKVFSDHNNKDFLVSMVMTGCDLSACAKPWPVHLNTIRIILDHFLRPEQNRSFNGGYTQDDVPVLQLDFLDIVCLPLYKAFASQDSRLDPLYYMCLSNRKEWKNLADKIAGGSNFTTLMKTINRNI